MIKIGLIGQSPPYRSGRSISDDDDHDDDSQTLSIPRIDLNRVDRVYDRLVNGIQDTIRCVPRYKGRTRIDANVRTRANAWSESRTRNYHTSDVCVMPRRID